MLEESIGEVMSTWKNQVFTMLSTQSDIILITADRLAFFTLLVRKQHG
jgi:hypothetical protein